MDTEAATAAIILAFTAALLGGFALLEARPECTKYDVVWVEEYTAVQAGQKHRPTHIVPAHWQNVCKEYEKEEARSSAGR